MMVLFLFHYLIHRSDLMHCIKLHDIAVFCCGHCVLHISYTRILFIVLTELRSFSLSQIIESTIRLFQRDMSSDMITQFHWTSKIFLALVTFKLFKCMVEDHFPSGLQ